MASQSLISALLLFSLFGVSIAKVHFSSLQRTIAVTISAKHGEVLKAGEDKIVVSWGLNQSFPASTAEAYKLMEVKICFAPISQKDRGWRKTNDKLSKDKTCAFSIVESNKVEQNNYEWTIEKKVPTATYFVRVYAFNSEGHEVAYGQSTDTNKTSNLFHIEGISGRTKSLEISSIVFSAFSIVALAGFFFVEKRKAKRAQKS